MSAHHAARAGEIPAERLAEAGVWIARLHGDDRDAVLEAGFRKWLQESPLNAQAFELTTEVWEDSQNLRRVVPFAHDVPVAPEPPRLRFPRPAWVGVGVAACALVAAALFHLQNDRVSTDIGEQRLLTLDDGTRVFLNTATRLVVRYDESVRKVELLTGEALFNVPKRTTRPFIVSAGDREVRALGTSFVVRRDEHDIAVTLVEGKVKVAAVTLVPGQRVTFKVGEPVRVDTPALEAAVAWRRGQVVLDDTPLAEAAAEMNRYSAVRLVVERPDAATLLVNGLFTAGDSMSFANAVAQTYGLQVIERGDHIVLSGTPKPIAR